MFGLADWHRDGTMAEYVAIEARNLAPLPGDVDFTVGASLPISGLTAWQGLFQHGRLQAGQSVLAHGAVGAVGTMVTQLAREAGAYVIGTGRAADREKALDFGAQEFLDLENDRLEGVGAVDLVFDVIGGDVQKRSAALIKAGGTLVSVVGPVEARPATAWQWTSWSRPIAPSWVRSCSGCGTDDSARTSEPSRPSAMPSQPSTRPSDARGSQSSAFGHSRSPRPRHRDLHEPLLRPGRSGRLVSSARPAHLPAVAGSTARHPPPCLTGTGLIGGGPTPCGNRPCRREACDEGGGARAGPKGRRVVAWSVVSSVRGQALDVRECHVE